MSKTTTVRARMQPEVKQHAEDVFKRLGITVSQAITMFYKQVELRGGLPFDVVVPNSSTKHTFESTDAGHDLIVCRDVDDMFERLGI